MSPLDDLIPSDTGVADDGIDLFTELIAAVAWLRRGAMPGLTMWDAIEKALRFQANAAMDWHNADPLRTSLQKVLDGRSSPVDQCIAAAFRVWLDATASLFNETIPWGAANSGALVPLSEIYEPDL